MTMKKQKTLHRFAAVAAVLLTLCLVFMMPVSAEGTTVNDANEFKSAFSQGGVITLGSDIIVDFQEGLTEGTNRLLVNPGNPVVLNLNGNTLTLNKPDAQYAISVKDNLTINGVGNVIFNCPLGIQLSISCGDNTGLTINGGTFTMNVNADTAFGPYMFTGYTGFIDINGGVFTGPYCIVNSFTNDNYGDGTGTAVTIDGGEFTVTSSDHILEESNSHISPLMYGEKASVTVNGGTFNVNNEWALGYWVLPALSQTPTTTPTINIVNDITINDDNDGVGSVEIEAPVKIVGVGDPKPTITCYAEKLFRVHADADFENLKLVNNVNGGRCIDTRVGGITVNIKDCELTAEGTNSQPLTISYDEEPADGVVSTVTLSGTTIDAGDSGYSISTHVPVTLDVQASSELSGYAALDLHNAADVTVTGSTLTGVNKHESADGWNSFGVIAISAKNVHVTLVSGTVGYAKTENTAEEAIILFNKNDGNSCAGSRVTINSGVTLEKNGDNAVFEINYDSTTELISVNEGVTSNFQIDSAYLADGCECVGSGNTWTVQIQTFSVQFDSKEGTTVGSQSIEYGNPVVRPADPTKEGYTFAGWYLSEMLYDFTTPVTDDITLTAKWNKNGEAVTVTPTISVTITVDQNSQTTIPKPTGDDTTVEFSNTEPAAPVAVITDTTTGVQMVVNFEKGAEKDTEGSVKGTVKSVEVKYPEAPAESEGDIKQEVNFVMGTATEKPPVIKSEKDDTVVEKVKKQEQRANVLAMITATRDNLEELNKNIKEVKITFRVHASLISNPHNLQGYHVDDNSDDVTAVTTQYSGKDGEYHVFTITSKLGFSSYVLVEEPQKSSGSAVDTGSGNYQYYPRSVPADGIVDFGTSKVVTGMELPAGSDGTVTLNIKPTFAMPENGFYAFEIDAPGYNLDAKINGGLSFQIPVADLEAAGWTAEDIVLFHGTVGEDGKITWEALPTNLVKNENGVACYKAAINSCSPFYIGFVKDGSVVNTEVVDPVTPETPETPVTPDEPEVLPPVDEPETPEQPTESPAPILAVLAGLGAAAVLRRK